MNLARYEGVKVRDMIRVLRKLGYRQVGTAEGKLRFFRKKGEDSLPVPFDTGEEMFPKMTWWMLNLLRLPDDEFDRLRRSS